MTKTTIEFQCTAIDEIDIMKIESCTNVLQNRKKRIIRINCVLRRRNKREKNPTEILSMRNIKDDFLQNKKPYVKIPMVIVSKNNAQREESFGDVFSSIDR